MAEKTHVVNAASQGSLVPESTTHLAELEMV